MRTILGVPLAATLMIITIAAAAPEAQRRRGNQGPPTVPVTTELVQAKPDAYNGQLLTLSSGVDQVLSKTAFTVDQRKVAPGGKDVVKAGKPLLVIAPTLTAAVEPNLYVTIVGEVMKLDPAALAGKAKDYKLDLAPEVVAKYQGQYVLLATTIHSPTFTELTKAPAAQ